MKIPEGWEKTEIDELYYTAVYTPARSGSIHRCIRVIAVEDQYWVTTVSVRQPQCFDIGPCETLADACALAHTVTEFKSWPPEWEQYINR